MSSLPQNWQDRERSRLQKTEEHVVDESLLSTTKPVGALIGGVHTSTTTTFTDGAFVPLQFDSAGRLKTDAVLNASSVTVTVDLTADNDSVTIFGRNGTTPQSISVNTSGYMEISIKEGGSAVQQYTAEATVPTEVSDGSTINVWSDTFGRQISYADNISIGAKDVSEVSPALLQVSESTLLNAVTTIGASSAINVINYNKLTFHVIVTEISTSVTVSLDSSLDNSNWNSFTTETITANGVTEYVVSDTKYKYVRTNFSAISGTDSTVAVTVNVLAGN